MRNPITVALLAAFAAASWSPRPEAQLLDRLKRKAEEVRAEAREAGRAVDSAADAEEGVGTAAERAMPSEADIEGRAAAEIEHTDEARELRRVEREGEALATTDERAQASAAAEARAAERELRAPERGARASRAEAAAARRQLESSADVEGRARGELHRSEAAGAVRGARRDARAAETVDEEVERELRETEEALEDVLD